MKKILLLIICIDITAAPYESAQRFEDGDTISADVLNDILDRIELTLKPIEISELAGAWTAKQYICNDGAYGNANFCDNTSVIGTTTTENTVFKTRTDTVTISDNGNNTINWTSPNIQLLMNSNWANNMQYSTGNLNHTCSISDAQILGCLLDSSIQTNNGNGIVAFINIKRTSPTQLVLFWGPDRGHYKMNHLILNKIDQPPKAPKELAISLASGKASLSWTAGDITETGYDIQRKNSSDGDFASIGTPSAESYEDSTIAIGNSYWYRVFATNANGTSVGSNVIQISYLNTPPSLNLSSTITVNEGVTEVVDVGASDADGDSLTYTLGSQDPSNDATNFSISSSGVISFNSAPDWENPSDYDTDNIYTINVSVSDGTDTVKQDISIVVQDIED